MTKEELLIKHCGYRSITEVNGVRVTSNVEKAMDEYAKQFSEKLIGWLNDNDFKFSIFHDNMQSDLVNNGIRMHKSEIIDLFIEQQTKSNG